MKLVYSVYKLTDENMLQWMDDYASLENAYQAIYHTAEWKNAELCIQENWIFSEEAPIFF